MTVNYPRLLFVLVIISTTSTNVLHSSKISADVFYTGAANDLTSMENLADLYTAAGQQPSGEDNRLFGKHGKILFEQVSTLNSMAMAKTGDTLATRLHLKLSTLQVKMFFTNYLR